MASQRNEEISVEGSYDAGGVNIKLSKKSAFMNRILTLSYENTNEEYLLLDQFLKDILESVQNEIKTFLKTNIALKYNIELHALYTKPNMQIFDNNSMQLKVLKTEMKESFYVEDFLQTYFMQVKTLKLNTEQFQAKEGGWTLWQLVKANFNINKYQPIKGGSFIYLPKSISSKAACINIENKDEYCFKWAVISSYFKLGKKATKTSSYPVDIEANIIVLDDVNLDFSGLSFPLPIKDISIFVQNNPSISITVFGLDKNDLIVGPCYKTKDPKSKHINLLYIEFHYQHKTVGHYVLIKDLSRLVKSQQTLNSNRIIICDNCLQYHGPYKEHAAESCQLVERVNYYEKCALEFKNSIKVTDVPFVIYAKTEDFAQYVADNHISKRIFIYFIKCSYDDSLNKWRIFKGPSAAQQFAKNLAEDAKYYYKNYSIKVMPKLALTQLQKMQHEHNFECCVCSKQISGEVKVKLHCRLTGLYKGPAHHACAMNFRVAKKFPVIFNNLAIDDCLLFIKEFSEIDDDPIHAKTLNNESFIAFEKDVEVDVGIIELRFLDFSKFLSCGLDHLIKQMPNENYKNLKSFCVDETKFQMILKKPIFPFKYFNSFEELEEITCLPDIKHLHFTEIEDICSADDYVNAQNLWLEFQCKTMQEYLELFLQIDVLFLTDIFENFRLVCKNAYNIDPSHYYSAAEFSWDAMLRTTDIKLSLPTDKDMISFLQNGMRPNISKCCQLYSKTNNKYLSDYNDRIPSTYLMNFHANDLYGRVMAEYLPQGNFKWENDVASFSLDSIPNDSEIGYILEVDLEYPKDIFDTQKTLPFCYEHTNSLEANDEGTVIDNSTNNKNNFVIYYKNLQQCLKHGLVLKKIHRILQFKQSDWLKKYLMLNKPIQQSETNSFDINVFKLMNTALFEKVMQKSEKKIKIVQIWESEQNKLGARIHIAKLGFSSSYICGENVVALELNTNVYNHVPVYLEFIFTELIKLKVYSFHYDYVIPKYKGNVQLNYIDMDTLIYTIKTDDLYRDIKNDIYTMIYPFDSENSHKSQLLRKTLGIMKDANDGVVLQEFIGFRPKLYCLKSEIMNKSNEDNVLVNICDFKILSCYANLLNKNRISCENIGVFKSKLFQRYAKLLEKLLPYLGGGRYVINNERNENVFKNENIIEID